MSDPPDLQKRRDRSDEGGSGIQAPKHLKGQGADALQKGGGEGREGGKGGGIECTSGALTIKCAGHKAAQGKQVLEYTLTRAMLQQGSNAPVFREVKSHN
jgi:hypothetical protein